MNRRPVIQGGITAVLAGILFAAGRHHLAAIPAAMSVVILITGFFLPRVYDRIDRLGRLLGHATGVTLSWVLLPPFFYLCFGSVRLMMLLFRKDDLQRKFPGKLPSYWQEHQRHHTDYRKQF